LISFPSRARTFTLPKTASPYRMSEKLLRRGDIVLVPFPFTDQTATKVRPALIVSADPQAEDLIVAFISSVIGKAESEKSNFILTPGNPDFASTGLHQASVFRMSKLLTIKRTLILRRLGKVTPELQAQLDQCIKIALALF